MYPRFLRGAIDIRGSYMLQMGSGGAVHGEEAEKLHKSLPRRDSDSSPTDNAK